MRLHEYQAKELFRAAGIPTPEGRVISTADEARKAAEELGGSVVVKAQVQVGGRGKAGGIKLVSTPDEAYQMAEQILSTPLKGLPVRKCLVEKCQEIKEENYLGIVVDRTRRCPVMIFSRSGGVDIEEVARTTPEKVLKQPIDPQIGLPGYIVRSMAVKAGLDTRLLNSFQKVASTLYSLFTSKDATLIEINPLAVVGEKSLLALDGKLIVDDNADYRQQSIAAEVDRSDLSPQEMQAKEIGVSYVKLDGNIGCIVNGAGLAMATMDLVKYFGAEPANFLDIGGGAKEEQIAQAYKIVVSDPGVKVVFVNIFGGIVRCDRVARGLLAARREVGDDIPLVVRLLGTNLEEALKLLKEAGVSALEEMEAGAREAVRLADSVETARAEVMEQ